MSKLYRFFFVALVLVQIVFCVQVVQAGDDTIQVTASGIGHTSDEALKDAYKNAVRRAVGVYVLTETVMNNEDINEKVYANSDGVVSSHEVLETKSLPNNLIEITIKATVQKNNIGQLLGKNKPTVIEKKDIVNVGNSLNAIEEVQKSLDLIFKDYPASLLTVEAIGQPVIDESKNVTADTIPMMQTVRISVNYPEYQKLVKKLMKLFDQNNYPKGSNQPFGSGAVDEILDERKSKNTFYLLTRGSPQMPPQKYSDMRGIGFRLPGQIMRHLQNLAHSHYLFYVHYEMTDLDYNVLGNVEYIGCSAFLLRDIGDMKEYGKGHFCASPCLGNSNKYCVIWPMCMDTIYYDRDYSCHEIYETCGSSFTFTSRFQVNRQVYENAQGLKINVSLYNKKTEETIAP